MTNKCVFLDRDGVLNVERGDYTWKLDELEVAAGVPEALAMLKAAGFVLVVITNQAGIAKGLYSRADVLACHEKIQQACGHAIDALYYSPAHPSVSASLARKPGTLLFERAIARFGLDPAQCWMVGDRERDILPARLLGMQTILVTEQRDEDSQAGYQTPDLLAAAKLITQKI